jgi:arginase family enzyme
VKYVFDHHEDANRSKEEGYDSHNAFSQQQGIIVRVCRKLERNADYSLYDYRKGNGLVHISIDLDFIKGFPALPWMSCGSNDIHRLSEYVLHLVKEYKLVRFDIGGYRELDRNEERMQQVYYRFYKKISEQLMSIMISL